MPSEEHYDDSAFTYFALSVLVVILIPSTLAYVKVWQKAFSSKYSGSCGCDQCRAKSKALQLESRKPSGGAIFKFILYVLAWVVFLLLLRSAADKSNGEAAPAFDPYEILGLDTGASADEIKQSYRKLSLKFHPDKNKAADAGDTYIRIGKAYETLTDPETREKWEKYGNPDGPQRFSIGIALPSWLVDNKNSSFVLGLYVVFLVIVFPSIAIYFWNRQKEVAANQLNKKTMYYFYSSLKENMRFKFLVEIVCLSYEYVTQIQLRRSDESDLVRLKPLLPAEEKKAVNKNKKKVVPPHAIKNSMLFYTHFSRLAHELSPAMREDLNILLRLAPHMCIGLVEMTAGRGWLIPALESVLISQMVSQAVWSEGSRMKKNTELLQIPYFTEDTISHLNGKKWKITSALQFAKMSPEKRREVLLDENFSEDQISDIENVVKRLPSDIEMRYETQVDDDDDENLGITGGSVVTLNVTFKRPSQPIENEKNKEDPIEVHAPYFPLTKNEVWWLFLGDERTNRIQGLKRIGSVRDGTEAKVLFAAPRKAGTYQFTLILMSDSYVGFDQRETIKINVSKEHIPVDNVKYFDDEDEEFNEDANHESGEENSDELENEEDDENENGEGKKKKKVEPKLSKKKQKEADRKKKEEEEAAKADEEGDEAEVSDEEDQ